MPAPPQEVVRAAVELAARDQPDELDARDVGPARAARARARAGTRPATPVRSRSTRFIDTCGRPAEASKNPSARTPGSPPSRSRISRAIRRAIATSRVTSTQLIATSGLRAPTAVAPSVGCGSAGPKSGARDRNAWRRSVREIARRRGRRRRRGTPARRASSAHHCAERARRVRRLGPFDLGPAERDERHDVERAETRVHARRGPTIEHVLGDRGREVARRASTRRAVPARRA